MTRTRGRRERAHRRTAPKLSPSEKRLGWVSLALYLLLFPILSGGVDRAMEERLNLSLAAAQSAAVSYAVALALLVAAFWELLRWDGVIFWKNVSRSFLSGLIAAGAGVGLTCLAGLIPLPVVNPVLVDYPRQLALSPAATVLVVCVLRPGVEEILYRLFLFGSLREWNRPAAYLLSSGLFALAAVWQYAVPDGGAYLLLALRYLPMGLVLAWSYDVAGAACAPLTARMVMSAAFLALAA